MGAQHAGDPHPAAQPSTCSVVELVLREGSWVPAREHRTASAHSLAGGSVSAADGSLTATPHSPRGPPLLRLQCGRLASLTLPSGRLLSLELPGALSGRLPPTPVRAPSGIRQASFNLSSTPDRSSMESEGASSRSPRLRRVTESPFEQS